MKRIILGSIILLFLLPFVLATSVQNTTNQTGWYKLDDLNQTVLNSAASQPAGILSGYTYYDGNVSLATITTGKYGYGYNFSADQAKIELQTIPDISGNVTFNFWVKPADAVAPKALYNEWAGNYNNFLLIEIVGLTPKITLYNSGAGGSVSATGALTNNAWNYLSVTFNNSVYSFYINGILSGTGTLVSVPSYSGITNIGHRSDSPTDEFIGVIDEVRIYNSTLTNGDIISDMNAYFPVQTPVCSYSFESNYTNASSTYTRDTSNFILGQINGSLSINSSLSQYVTVSSADTRLTGTYTTYSWWAKQPDTASVSRAFFSKMSGPYTNYIVVQSIGSTVQLDIANAGVATGTVIWENVIPDSDWHHFFMVFNGSTSRLYVDGVDSGLKTLNTALPSFNGPFEIGSRTDARALGYTGQIDNFQVWNLSRSAYDALAEYYSGLNSGNYDLFTIIARDNVSNSTIPAFNATVNGTTYTTTSGRIVTPITYLNQVLSITADANNYATSTANYNITSITSDLIIYMYGDRSIYFVFSDEQTGKLINATVTFDLIGTTTSYLNTTANGTKYLTALNSDNYTIRYSAPNYGTRFYYIEVTPKSFAYLNLTLLNVSVGTNVTVTLYDQNRALVKNALIKILKYSSADNTYTVKDATFTDMDGNAYFDVMLNSEFYKFIVEYPANNVVLITNPAYIRSTAIVLQYTQGSSGTSLFDTFMGVSKSFTFNNATNNFRFDYTDNSNKVTRSCVYVFNEGDQIAQSCVNGATGSILVPVTNITGQIYQADAYFTIHGVDYYAGSQVADFRVKSDYGLFGLMMCVFLMIAVVLMLRESPKLAVTVAPIPLILFNVVGWVVLDWWIPISLMVLSWIVAYLISRWS